MTEENHENLKLNFSENKNAIILVLVIQIYKNKMKAGVKFLIVFNPCFTLITSYFQKQW